MALSPPKPLQAPNPSRTWPGLPFAVGPVSAHARCERKPFFFSKNPNSRPPALHDPPTRASRSGDPGAIMEYLIGTYDTQGPEVELLNVQAEAVSFGQAFFLPKFIIPGKLESCDLGGYVKEVRRLCGMIDGLAAWEVDAGGYFGVVLGKVRSILVGVKYSYDDLVILCLGS
ncbi:hypothetical protein ACO22_06303 [Paracoccidioides brasiliensis]|uniref:GST N-terminal domain-containing protein n=1 Tax=Paracoccidioides brasiliensis TaxID=121759 RepID=A0A1D2J7U4_PARBR|nr:hypothetical protein ACO22_06303 [Paracoccidioides brasiliensis]